MTSIRKGIGTTVATIWLLLAALPAAAQDCPNAAQARAGADQILAESPADRESVLAAQARLDALRARVLQQAPDASRYGGVSHWAVLGRAAIDPRLKALFERVAQDQLTRILATVLQLRTEWAEGLSDKGKLYFQILMSPEMCSTDRENSAWLKADLDRNGWYGISRYGKEADMAAWLMVQHSDQDLPFQQKVLAMLEPLVATGDTSKSNFAYLVDRVAVNSGRPQRYGTQGLCTGPGKWEPREMEDPANLDRRRADVGLPPEAEYIEGFKTICP